MRSRARLLGHPLHPMLVVLPSALFPLLLLLDVVHWFSGHDAAWEAGFWIAVAGVVTTIAAMVPGTIDLAHVPDGTKAHRTGLWHAIVGTATLLAYVAAVWARWDAGTDRLMLGLAIDVVGTGLVSVQGWLGGELVYKHHVGVNTVEEGAEPVILADSPGEASGREAAPRRRDARP